MELREKGGWTGEKDARRGSVFPCPVDSVDSSQSQYKQG